MRNSTVTLVAPPSHRQPDAAVATDAAVPVRLNLLDRVEPLVPAPPIGPLARAHPLPARPSEVHVALAAAPAAVAVYCLGSFGMEIGGVAVEGWRASKARSLFQYLVTHRNRLIPRTTLIEALWPDPEALAAGTSLKVAVHALRQALAQSCGEPALLTIVAQDSGYQLTARDLWLDVEEFERACSRARRLEAQGQPIEALAEHARAAELYRGDFLEECWDDWVVFRRERLKDQYLSALARLASAAFEAGDYDTCILRCQQLLAQDRCREDTYRSLMLSHARLGQFSRVRRWYEMCLQALRAELDVEPEPETERVYRLAMSRGL